MNGLEFALKEVLGDLAIDVYPLRDEGVVKVKPEKLLEVAQKVKEAFSLNYLRCLSVVDYGASLEVVYHLYSIPRFKPGAKPGHKVILKTVVSISEPVVPSVVSVWKGADWHEREGAEMFGVVFSGHPNLKPLLLEEDSRAHPLLKSYPLGGEGEDGA